MTLGELLDYLYIHPYFVVFYFVALPLAAYLGLLLGKGEGHLNPWCYFYTALIYLSVIPGVFALLLNIYHLLFENISIYEVNLLVHVLPVASMFISLYLTSKNVSFDMIPGFGRMTNFISSIAGIMIVLFVLNKTRIVIFSFLPIIWLVIIILGLYIAIRMAGKFLAQSGSSGRV